MHTALREYALSSASVRASTKRRRRLGRFEGYYVRVQYQVPRDNRSVCFSYHSVTSDVVHAAGIS